ncbi:MAG: hypothetical protein AAFR35_00235 [Pseudomonadota bacterium]
MTQGWDAYFTPGERLLWEGGAAPGVREAWKYFGLSVFGLPFLAAGLFVEAQGLSQLIGGGWNSVMGVVILAFGLPFVFAGAGLVFGPWWAAKTAPERVRYGLSTRRAYIAKRWLTRHLSVYSVDPEAEIWISENRDGTGSVGFHARRMADSDGPVWEKASFDHIKDPHHVYTLLREIQEGPRS